MLPTDSKARKGIPLIRGCLDYFPDALVAVALLSQAGNDKHNPGEPLHWSREKSSDHADCIGRHLIERGTIDPEDGILHDVKVAWRALAMAQLAIEKQRGESAMSYARTVNLSEPEKFGPYPGKAPEDDGWIEWKGGARPVHADTKIDVRFTDGGCTYGWRAGTWFWGDANIYVSSGIVAYRIAR